MEGQTTDSGVLRTNSPHRRPRPAARARIPLNGLMLDLALFAWGRAIG